MVKYFNLFLLSNPCLVFQLLKYFIVMKTLDGMTQYSSIQKMAHFISVLKAGLMYYMACTACHREPFFRIVSTVRPTLRAELYVSYVS